MAKNKKSPISRRQFIKQATAAGVATTVLAPFAEKLFAQTVDTKEYDYVVIGSGAGGGPVAANLVREGFRVCLIEAGGTKSEVESEVPAYHGLASEHPNLSWSFSVAHYSNRDRQKLDSKYNEELQGILYPRGSTLGGSTAVNAMITMYPDNSDWENIRKITGNPSWGASEMRKYFQEVENCNYRRRGVFNQARHGYGGWLSTDRVSPEFLFRDPQIKATVLAAFASQGLDALSSLKKQLDPNDWRYVGKKFEGIFNTPTATLNGKRNGVRQLLLDTQAQFPEKLHIFSNCLANRIVFSRANANAPLKAQVVEFSRGSRLYKADKNSDETTRSYAQPDFVKVKREVILAGGAFNSPQLLMLSGIGPADVLERHGIPVLHELKGVGQNLQDRYEVGVVSETKADLQLARDCSLDPTNDKCLDEYRPNPQQSIYSSNGVVLGLIKKSNTQQPDPDLYVFGLPGSFTGYYPGWAKDSFQKNKFTWAVLKGHTRNTAGYVTLKSASPMDTPEINFKYFAEGNDELGDDLRAVVQGIKIAREINKKGAAILRREVTPGPEYSTDAELEEFVRKEAWGHHASCTNKMGVVQDEKSVVDSEFRVHGTQNLRIVDASVFPKIPGLFIAAPIYMIAQKATRDILRATR